MFSFLKTHKSKVLCFSIFVFAFLYHFDSLAKYINAYDEGLVFYGAKRVLEGELPNKDFWTIYPPGQFFTLAIIFYLFGPSVMVARVYDLILRILLPLFIFNTLKRAKISNSHAFFSSIFIIFLHHNSSIYGGAASPLTISLCISVLAIDFIVSYLNTNNDKSIYLAALFTTFVAVYKHDMGALLLIAISIVLTLYGLFKSKVFYKLTAIYFFTSVIAGLFFLFFLTKFIALEALINQLLITPKKIMYDYRYLPFPKLATFNGLKIYILSTFLIMGVFLALFQILIMKNRGKDNFTLLLYAMQGVFLTSLALVRSDSGHFLPALVFSFLVLPFLYKEVAKLKNRFWKFGMMILVVLSLVQPVGLRAKPWFVKNLWAEELKKKQMFEATVDYLKTNTNIDEFIYVGVQDHDQFIINDVAIYFLADRRSATRYHELHPGVTNTFNVQKEIIGELKSKKVNTIILTPNYWPEPNMTSIKTNINILNDYIRDNVNGNINSR